MPKRLEQWSIGCRQSEPQDRLGGLASSEDMGFHLRRSSQLLGELSHVAGYGHGKTTHLMDCASGPFRTVPYFGLGSFQACWIMGELSTIPIRAFGGLK